MAEKKTRILLRSDLVARWEEVNPVLLKGELGIAYNPQVQGYEKVRIKIGDGVAHWNALPYVADYDAKIAELEDEIQEAVAALDAKIAKKVDKELIGDLGKSLLFNEKDGGGAKFEGNNGVNAYVGIHDNIGGEIGAQIYVDKANGEESTIIDVTQNGAYYTKGEIKPGAQRDVEANEIAVKGDLEGKAEKADVEEALAGKVDKVEGSSLMSTAEHNKLEGVEEGAQVNKLEEVKLSGNFLEIKHDVEGHGPYVDLGNIATSGAIEAEAVRAKAAEEALGGRLDVIEGKEAGWDAKADKTYVDTELAKKANAADVYVKSEVYNKSETEGKIAEAIAGIKHWSYKVVNELPTPGPECEHIIYLVSKGSGKTGYKEYVCINVGTEESPDWKFEEIGDTDIDLSEYRKSAAQDVIDNEIKGLINTEKERAEGKEAELNTALGTKVAQSEYDSKIAEIEIDISDLDSKSHEHANKDLLDSIVAKNLLSDEQIAAIADIVNKASISYVNEELAKKQDVFDFINGGSASDFNE